MTMLFSLLALIGGLLILGVDSYGPTLCDLCRCLGPRVSCQGRDLGSWRGLVGTRRPAGFLNFDGALGLDLGKLRCSDSRTFRSLSLMDTGVSCADAEDWRLACGLSPRVRKTFNCNALLSVESGEAFGRLVKGGGFI